ncbi:MAG: hypothetical protein QG652_459 [Pseudomonadota bacterium]|nr:hypothetical protein [Pseudomonadota bacterium]
MVETDVRNVLEWRNHPDVRRYMFTQHEISFEEHQAWFARANRDESKRLLIVEENSVPLGFVHFSQVLPGGVSDWGFYAVPGQTKGMGKKIGITAIEFAFNFLKLHKVCGQALGFNEASIRLHRTLGFQQEGVLREQHRINKDYYDVICFGLLNQDWLTWKERNTNE